MLTNILINIDASEQYISSTILIYLEKKENYSTKRKDISKPLPTPTPHTPKDK